MVWKCSGTSVNCNLYNLGGLPLNRRKISRFNSWKTKMKNRRRNLSSPRKKVSLKNMISWSKLIPKRQKYSGITTLYRRKKALNATKMRWVSIQSSRKTSCRIKIFLTFQTSSIKPTGSCNSVLRGSINTIWRCLKSSSIRRSCMMLGPATWYTKTSITPHF